MKIILHIVGRMDRGGAESMIMNFYREINKSDFQFYFVYFTEDECHFDREIIEMGGKIFRLAGNRYTNPISRAIGIFKIFKENNNIEILHTHSLLSSAFHVLAAYIAGIKIRIVHSHNTDDINHHGFIGKIYKKISVSIINFYGTDFLACGSEASKFLFPKNKKAIQIANSINTKLFFNASRNKEYLTNEFNIKKSSIKIIQVARFANVKNHLFTVKFAKFLKDCGIDFTFFLVGDGKLKESIFKEVKQLDVHENFIFLGIREDIAQLLGGSDVFFMPSLHEGFPVSLVESQTVGIPALISDSISDEVDLGVGLINSCSLQDDFSVWKEKLLNIKSSSYSPQERLKILSEKGYDSKININFLESIYSKHV